MPILKLSFRSHGDESKPVDFQMSLKKPSRAAIKKFTPEQRRKLADNLKIFEQAFINYKKNIASALSE